MFANNNFFRIFFKFIKDVSFIFNINLMCVSLLYIIINEIRQSYLFITVRKHDMEVEIITSMHKLTYT